MSCKAVRKDGEKCNANAMKDSDYCYLHNPDISKEEKKNCQSKGWKANGHVIAKPLSPLEIWDMKWVVLLLQDTINSVRTGDLDVKTANCIWFLSNHLMKAYELDQIEVKLDKLKNVLRK